jgi:proline utilization trans-activator
LINPDYRGNSSSTNAAMRLRSFIKPMSESLGGLEAQMERPTYSDTAWPRRPSVSILPQLPPYEFAKRLHAAQHSYIGTIFSFVEAKVFDKRLQSVYLQAPDFSDHAECLSYCQILLVLAFGQMYSVNQWAGHDGPPGFQYFMQVLQILPEIHEEGSILFVEVLSLVGYYMQNLNRRDAAFLYIGLALRMAISLGLHQEVSDSSLDNIAREHRRRVWWSVYSMDRILCVKSGNPITIADEDIGISLPSKLPEIDFDSLSAAVLSHYTQLSRILGKIMEGIYRKGHKTGSSLLASVQSIMSDLSNWVRALPDELRFNFNQVGKDVSRESVSILLHYNQCINMTARPLLFHVVRTRLENMVRNQMKPNWREGLSPATVAVIESCIRAARSSVTIMTAAAQKNLVATYGFMDGEHAFSAALVLVMINVAFPFNAQDGAAMEAALDVLREMAERGNSHIRARHLLLMDLRSAIGQLPFHGLSGVAPSEGDVLAGAGMGDYVAQEGTFPTPPQYLETTMDLNGTSFNLSVNEDVRLWEESSGSIGIGMDIDWIEAARSLHHEAVA